MSLGIPYNSFFHQCRDCVVFICEQCHSRHDRSHQQYFARCKVTQWETRMQSLDSERLCDRCSQSRKARVECWICDANLCITCWEDRDRQIEWQRTHFLRSQDHKEFSMIFPK